MTAPEFLRDTAAWEPTDVTSSSGTAEFLRDTATSEPSVTTPEFLRDTAAWEPTDVTELLRDWAAVVDFGSSLKEILSSCAPALVNELLRDAASGIGTCTNGFYWVDSELLC